jgi:hypothetical protein
MPDDDRVLVPVCVAMPDERAVAGSEELGSYVKDVGTGRAVDVSVPVGTIDTGAGLETLEYGVDVSAAVTEIELEGADVEGRVVSESALLGLLLGR